MRGEKVVDAGPSDAVTVRRAVAADAAASCELVRRSIVELCQDDHCGDEATLAAWLRNKTPPNFRFWIRSDRHAALVAEDARGIVGFGLLNLAGYIALLYVSPDARFQGVSKTLLGGLERAAVSAGVQRLTAESSATALRFYLQHAYVRDGQPTSGFGITRGYPVRKALVPTDRSHPRRAPARSR